MTPFYGTANVSRVKITEIPFKLSIKSRRRPRESICDRLDLLHPEIAQIKSVTSLLAHGRPDGSLTAPFARKPREMHIGALRHAGAAG